MIVNGKKEIKVSEMAENTHSGIINWTFARQKNRLVCVTTNTKPVVKVTFSYRGEGVHRDSMEISDSYWVSKTTCPSDLANAIKKKHRKQEKKKSKGTAAVTRSVNSFSKKGYQIYASDMGKFGDCAEESVLKKLGYSVSQKDNLSTKQRRDILEYVVDKGICSSNRVASFLQYLIENNGKRKNMEMAVSKWESDRDFILRYV